MSKISRIITFTLVFALALIGWLWYGTPLKTDGAPASVPGHVYFLRRQPDQLLAVMKQPADMSEPAEKLIHRVDCPETNCNVIGVHIQNGVLEYTAMYKGEWYRFYNDEPVEPEIWEPTDAPAGAENKSGSLFVDGQEILKFTGSYDSKFAPGYCPLTWINDDRHLVFFYNGYSHGAVSFVANFVGLGRNRGGCYLWDRQTEKITPFIEGSNFVWVND